MNPRLVVVAEDDADIREMLTVTLEAAGFRAVGAKDGRTAARILAVAQPVGLITDVLMPTLNGIELCRLARLNPAVRDTAILMVSGNSHRYDIEAGMAAGADRYLPKPLQPRALVAELQHIISSRHPIG